MCQRAARNPIDIYTYIHTNSENIWWHYNAKPPTNKCQKQMLCGGKMRIHYEQRVQMHTYLRGNNNNTQSTSIVRCGGKHSLRVEYIYIMRSPAFDRQQLNFATARCGALRGRVAREVWQQHTHTHTHKLRSIDAGLAVATNNAITIATAIRHYHKQ